MRPSQTIQTATLDYISMVQYTTAVTPVRYQWNYCSLALRYIYIYIYTLLISVAVSRALSHSYL